MAEPFWQRAGSWQSCHPILETFNCIPAEHARTGFFFALARREAAGVKDLLGGSYACCARRELTVGLGLFGLSNNPETVLIKMG